MQDKTKRMEFLQDIENADFNIDIECELKTPRDNIRE